MKAIRAALRWHLRRAQIARKKGDLKARERHLLIVEKLARQICPQDCDGRPGADAYSKALDQWDKRQCADCGYPLDDNPVFLGGVWFCATCNPAISHRAET